MNTGIVSMRYVKALLTYAVEHGEGDAVYEEMKMLSVSFRQEPRIRKVLDSPVVAREEKLDLLVKAARGNGTPSDTFLRFMKLILQNKREGHLQLMALSYMGLYRKRNHIGVSRLITAVPISDEVRKRIQGLSGQVLHAKMEMEVAVDPAIIGGFVFEVNGYRLDASIANQLKQMRQQFIDKNKRII